MKNPTFRILRAFAWMRWRVLLNSLERTGARDTIERLSLAVEQIGPWIAFGLLVPSALILAALGGYAGYRLGIGESRVLVFEVLRIVLLVTTGFTIVGPLLMPSMERTSAIRLLLLPIPRRVLYIAQAAGALSEPWIILAAAVLVGIPIGLAIAGAIAAALIALGGAILFVLLLVGVSALATLVLQLIVRDRRRGELVALVFIIIIPLLSILPGLIGVRYGQDRDARRAAERNGRTAPAEPAKTNRAIRIATRTYVFLPSELVARATRVSGAGQVASAAVPLLALFGYAAALHGLGFLAFQRLLDSPASAGRRHATGTGVGWMGSLPGLSRGSAAVAHAHVRLAARTPRGRSILISPVVVFAVIAVVARSGAGMELGALHLTTGLSLATFGSSVCLLSILPIAMNQFAIDRAGLTLALLSPLETRELLAGKAAGNGIIAGGPALVCVLIGYALFPSGPFTLWISLPLGLLGTYLLTAPGAAVLSAIFPRAVNLNSIGRGSNAHGVAGTLGLLLFALAGVPPIVLTLLANVIGRPGLTPILLAVWAAIALLLSRGLFTIVAPVFDRRKENLAIVAK